ncbi:MAG: corrinoid protein [Proteobacteria bacterium]|nr:corrinoid protein [Pseudomonadota bacterium]
MANFDEIGKALVDCNEDKVVNIVNSELSAGTPASDILDKGLISGMDIVGQKMESGEMFIPEVLMCANIMNKCVAILKPSLSDDTSSNSGDVIIGTVKGDLHDIGKNLVKMMMESAGMNVHDLGVDIDPVKFVSEVKEKNANVVCLSALLTTTMPTMKQTVEAIVDAGLREQVKILVGGAPVTQAFADEIGADGYAADAGSAARLAKTFA